MNKNVKFGSKKMERKKGYFFLFLAVEITRTHLGSKVMAAIEVSLYRND